MNNTTRNRKNKNNRTMKGGLVGTFFKEMRHGKSHIDYKLPVSESSSFDSDTYEVLGALGFTVGSFSPFRGERYIEQYLKSEFIDKALQKFSKASKVVGYKVEKHEDYTRAKRLALQGRLRKLLDVKNSNADRHKRIVALSQPVVSYNLTGIVLGDKNKSKTRKST